MNQGEEVARVQLLGPAPSNLLNNRYAKENYDPNILKVVGVQVDNSQSW